MDNMDKYNLFMELFKHISAAQKDIRDYDKGNLASHTDLFKIYTRLQDAIEVVCDGMHEAIQNMIAEEKEKCGLG